MAKIYAPPLLGQTLAHTVPLKSIEYGFGYIIIRSPYTPYSTYLRGDYILKKIELIHRVFAGGVCRGVVVLGSWEFVNKG